MSDEQRRRETLRTGFESVKEDADKDAAMWKGKGKLWMACHYALSILTIVSAVFAAYVSGSGNLTNGYATASALLAAGLAAAASTLRPGTKWDNAQSGERENEVISAGAEDGINDSDTGDLDELAARLEKLRGRRDAAINRKSPE